MKNRTNAFAVAVLTLISAWGLGGCSQEHATNTKTDSPYTYAKKVDEQGKLSEGKTADHTRDVQERHDGHTNDARERHEHPDHNARKHSGHRAGDHLGHTSGKHHEKEEMTQGSVKVGDRVPDFSVKTLDGKNVKLSDLQKDENRTKTGVVLFSFWCSTCHSCRDVEDMLAKLSKDYEGQAAVIALDANANETATGVVAFIKDNELELPIVLDPSGNTADLFGVTKTTTTIVIDGNGVLRYCGQFQQRGGGSAEDALKAVLAGNEVTIKTTPHIG